MSRELLQAEQPEKEYFEVIPTDMYSKESVESAKLRFDEYLQKGVIYNCAFPDNSWHTSNQRELVGVDFNIPVFDYAKNYCNLLGISYSDFIDYVKTYFVFHMGELVLSSLRSTVNDIKKLISSDPHTLNTSQSIGFVSPIRLSDFISCLPVQTDDDSVLENIIESIESENEAAAGKQRELATFDSMMMFNDIIDDFWNTEKDETVRAFYAPVYFWWHITMIIPTRPTEFIVTARNCLQKVKRSEPDNDGHEYDYYLTLRKDKLKGCSRRVGYSLSEDFFEFRVHISYSLGQEIEKYISNTDKYDSTDLDTLLLQTPHYRHWHHIKPVTSRYYTYVNLSTALRYFLLNSEL